MVNLYWLYNGLSWANRVFFEMHKNGNSANFGIRCFIS